MRFTKIRNKTVIAISMAAFLAGCSDSDNVVVPLPDPPPPPVQYSYTVEVTNLTFAQPMSPVAVIAHNNSYSLFNIGEAATVGLEQLAESGDNSGVLSEATATGAFATGSGVAILPPSSTEMLSFSITEEQASMSYLSLATMLVNTNDAMTAARNIDLSGLEVGGSMSFTTLSYDAGTESNSESVGTIPGPVAGGEGFNATRDDITDQVTLHGGVVTSDDGLSSSVLSQKHRWDNPVLKVTISRTE